MEARCLHPDAADLLYMLCSVHMGWCTAPGCARRPWGRCSSLPCKAHTANAMQSAPERHADSYESHDKVLGRSHARMATRD
jgi:hypothetical protein